MTFNIHVCTYLLTQACVLANEIPFLSVSLCIRLCAVHLSLYSTIFRRLMRAPSCLCVYSTIFRRLMRSPSCLCVYATIFRRLMRTPSCLCVYATIFRMLMRAPCSLFIYLVLYFFVSMRFVSYRRKVIESFS
jgi:hypothetical protein